MPACERCGEKDARTIAVGKVNLSLCRPCLSDGTTLSMWSIAKAAGPKALWTVSLGNKWVKGAKKYKWPFNASFTQMGAPGAAALGTAAALKARMRKRKIEEERLYTISFIGAGGSSDTGLTSISAAMTHPYYDLLVAITEPIPRLDLSIPAMILTGQPNVRYVATACTSYPSDLFEKTRFALDIGGPTAIHVLDPWPKSEDYLDDPKSDLGRLAVETGAWPLYEVVDGAFKPSLKPERRPVKEYLAKEPRYSDLKEDEMRVFQENVDNMWKLWLVPGMIPTNKA